jgi:hypothetical protein
MLNGYVGRYFGVGIPFFNEIVIIVIWLYILLYTGFRSCVIGVSDNNNSIIMVAKKGILMDDFSLSLWVCLEKNEMMFFLIFWEKINDIIRNKPAMNLS